MGLVAGCILGSGVFKVRGVVGLCVVLLVVLFCWVALVLVVIVVSLLFGCFSLVIRFGVWC